MDPLPEDIERMADFLGREDPAIRRLLKSYIRNPKMRETVRTLLKRRCVQAGFDPDDPPVFWPVRDLNPGILSVGRVVQGTISGPQLALPGEIITQHLGIFGHNGTGKTYLAMHLARQAIQAGLRLWVFDIEDEYSRLSPALPTGTLVGLEPEQLRLNLFQPPGEWISPARWLDELSLLLRGGTFLRDGSLNIFRMGMAKLLERRGITTGGTDWPSLLEVIEYFQGLSFGPKSRSAGFIESLLNRLVTLGVIFDQTARVTNSHMLSSLSRRSVIFRLHSLTGIPLQFLVNFLLLWLARFREGQSNDKPHGVVIEEAHMLASEKGRQDIGESALCRMFRTARKRGISLILCDQVPSELPPAILGNLACRIVMRLVNARCVWSVQNSMGLDRRQADAIATMEQRRAIVQYTLQPHPFAVKVPQMDFPAKPEDQELRRQAEDLLSAIQWSEWENDRQKASGRTGKVPAPDGLGGDALLVMVRICEAPAELIEQRCEVLRMDRAREFRARAELDTRGLIKQVKQTIGGKVKFFQPTDKGVAWAKKRKIFVKTFKSGIVHEYLLCQVEKRIGLIGPKWRLQRNSSIARDHGLQPDLLVLGPDGRRIIVEVCCNNFKYDAKNIVIEAKTSGIDQVVAITPDKRTKHSLEQALERTSGYSDEGTQQSISVLDAGQCLADDFDWAREVASPGPKTQKKGSDN